MVDHNIQPLGINVIGPEEMGEEATYLDVAILTGVPLPIPDPNNPSQPIIVPTDQYRVPMTKDFALRFAEKLREEAEKLPDEPKSSPIQVATSIQGADKLSELEKRLRA